MAALGEVGLDPLLEGGETKLFEPGDLGLREQLVGEVCERRAAPERERLAQPVRAALRDESFEPLEVELPRLDLDRVAGRPSDDSLCPEGLPELRDEVLESVQRRSGRL